MLRKKESELAENIDNTFGWFDLNFYRVESKKGTLKRSIAVRIEVEGCFSGKFMDQKCSRGNQICRSIIAQARILRANGG